MPRGIERLYGPMLRGPLILPMSASVNAFAGIATINSGSATVVVSTSRVSSDSIIFAVAHSPTNASSGFGRPVEVKSINPGVSFVLGTADGVAPRAANTPVMWMLARPG